MKKDSLWYAIVGLFLLLSIPGITLADVPSQLNFSSYSITSLPVTIDGVQYEDVFRNKNVLFFYHKGSLTFWGNSSQDRVSIVSAGHYVYYYSWDGNVYYFQSQGDNSGISTCIRANGTDVYNPILSSQDLLHYNQTAYFSANISVSHLLTVTLNPQAGGTVTSSPAGIDCPSTSCTGNFSGNVTLTETPADGWEFSNWLEGCNGFSGTQYTVNMTGDKEVKAIFKLLSFPLAGYSAYDAPVSAVFDHSGIAQYDNTDYQVMTFKGEASEVQTPYSGTTCYPKSDNSAFGLGFNYTGISGAGAYYLCYSGHPGFDYSIANNTAVYAASDGIAHIPSGFPGVLNAQTYNTVEVDHQDGYKTYYLHLSSQNVTENQQVYRGQTIIGYSGDTGSAGAYHLHFEVQKDGIPVDPYGWQGTGNDPYTRANSYNLWK